MMERLTSFDLISCVAGIDRLGRMTRALSARLLNLSDELPKPCIPQCGKLEC
jgi:hypothetical protein